MEKSKLRISILGPVYPYRGGISHYTSELCNHLSNSANIQIISFSRTLFKWLYHAKKDYASKKFLEGTTQFIFDIYNPFTWKRTAKRIINFNPDVLIFQWDAHYRAIISFYFLLKAIRNECNCKIMAVCHDVFLPKRIFLDKVLTKRVFENVDIFIIHADRDYANIRRMISNADIRKLFHPIYDLFYEQIDQRDAKQKLGLEGNVLLFFGYVRPYKGLLYLINSLPHVLKKVTVQLLIVGDFLGDKEKYLKQIRQLKLEQNIRIIDRYVSNQEVPIYFSAADAVITPYIGGTQSGVINIAYAFNKPVITTRVGGLGEIVKDGKTGYVVEPRSINGLAEAIIKFYKNDQKNRFKNEIKKIKKDYSWETLSREIIKLIR